MTSKIENKAKDFLLKRFRHKRYVFSDKDSGEKGYDMMLLDKTTNKSTKVELKAHSGRYTSPSSIRDRLIFNSKAEKEMFESGESIIVRVYLDSKPYSVILVTHKLLIGAEIEQNERYTIKGRVNYEGAFEKIA